MADSTSEGLRQRGNDLYRQGEWEQAIELYSQAALAAPTEPAPVGNLSAAYLESGQYAAAIEACDKAIDLHGSSTDKTAARDKLLSRKCKLCIFERRFEDASKTLEQLSSGPEKVKLQQVLTTVTSNTASVQDTQALHARLITEIPRCKASLSEAAEYFTVGHDTPTSLLEPELLATDQAGFNVLFGGVSDARNLMQTLVSLGTYYASGQKAADKRFHFTINDIKAAVLARDVVILALLSLRAEELRTGANASTRSDCMICLLYVYLAPTMPQKYFSMLQQVFKDCIRALKGETALPAFLDVPHKHRKEVIQVLSDWQDPVYAAMPNRSTLRMAFGQRQEDDAMNTDAAGRYHMSYSFFERTSMLVLDRPQWLDIYDEDLRRIYQAFNLTGPQPLDDQSYDDLSPGWAQNPTIYENITDTLKGPRHIADVLTANSPFDWCNKMPCQGNDGFVSHFAPWIDRVCATMNRLERRYRIEVSIGDILQLLEETQLSASPREYDRIHLSNIPDYIGGSLTTFLYALPVLSSSARSYVTANNLRNPGCFPNEAAYHTEYTALAPQSEVERVFQVRSRPSPGSGMDFLSMLGPPLRRYTQWYKAVRQTGAPNLMKRPELETWLVRLFLKIALPMKRPAYHFRLIFSPLGLSVFVKLCVYLHSIGYPVHWLDGVLTDLCSGRISSRARPPRSNPLSAEEVATRRPEIQQSVAPFAQELSVLLGLWQPTLAFGITSTHVPPIKSIHRYSVTFERLNPLEEYGEENGSPAFTLIVYNTKLSQGIAAGTFREFFLGDEKGNTSAKAVEFREQGVHMISAWERTGRTASFAFQSTLWERLQDAACWEVNIFRTDVYMMWAQPMPLSNVNDLGPWVDWKYADA